MGLALICEPLGKPVSEPVEVMEKPSHEGNSMTALNDPQLCGNRSASLFDHGGLIGWLRSRFPNGTGFHVEHVTGISSATVDNWIQRRSRPSVEHYHRLMVVFGPSLVRACLRGGADWLDEACRRQRAVEIENEMAALKAEQAALEVSGE